jgi:hypothetical protein
MQSMRCVTRLSPAAMTSDLAAEIKEMIDAVRIAERALGSVTYAQEAESSSRALRCSLFVVEDVAALVGSRRHGCSVIER